MIKDQQIVHAKGYGVRSLNTGQSVNEHTLFGIASNSKAFTAAGLAILVYTNLQSGAAFNAISPLTDFSFDFQDLDLKRKTP